jgi:hypothetical protein
MASTSHSRCGRSGRCCWWFLALWDGRSWDGGMEHFEADLSCSWSAYEVLAMLSWRRRLLLEVPPT